MASDLLSDMGEQVTLLVRKEQGSDEASVLLECARRRGVEGLVAEYVLRTAKNESVRAEAKAAFVRNFFQAAAYQGRFAELEKAFRAHGIEAIALKGLPLSLNLFLTKVGTRELSDIDLLFQKEQLPRVREILQSMGYVKRNDTDMGYQQEGYYLDLHVRLLDRVDKAYRFELDTVWSRREKISDSFEAVQALEPHLNFCYLSAHAMDHGFSRLKWIVDLVMLLPRCDGERLKSIASETNSLHTVLVSLLVIRELFGAELPEPLENDVARLGWLEAQFVRKVAADALPTEAGKFFAIWNAEGFTSKIKVLRRLTSVEGESLSQRLRRVRTALRGLLAKGS